MRLVLFDAGSLTERAKLRDADEMVSATDLWRPVWSEPHPSLTHLTRRNVKKILQHRTAVVKSGVKKITVPVFVTQSDAAGSSGGATMLRTRVW